MKEKTRRIVGSVAGIVAALSFGVALGIKLASPFETWTRRVATDALLMQYAQVQFSQATHESAISAQMEVLRYLDDVEKQSHRWTTGPVPWMTPSILAYNRIVTYGRLAILEEKRGNLQSAEKNWVLAEAQANSIKWKNPSRDKVRRVVQGIQDDFKKWYTDTR